MGILSRLHRIRTVVVAFLTVSQARLICTDRSRGGSLSSARLGRGIISEKTGMNYSKTLVKKTGRNLQRESDRIQPDFFSLSK